MGVKLATVRAWTVSIRLAWSSFANFSCAGSQRSFRPDGGDVAQVADDIGRWPASSVQIGACRS